MLVEFPLERSCRLNAQSNVPARSLVPSLSVLSHHCPDGLYFLAQWSVKMLAVILVEVLIGILIEMRAGMPVETLVSVECSVNCVGKSPHHLCLL